MSFLVVITPTVGVLVLCETLTMEFFVTVSLVIKPMRASCSALNFDADPPPPRLRRRRRSPAVRRRAQALFWHIPPPRSNHFNLAGNSIRAISSERRIGLACRFLPPAHLGNHLPFLSSQRRKSLSLCDPVQERATEYPPWTPPLDAHLHHPSKLYR